MCSSDLIGNKDFKGALRDFTVANSLQQDINTRLNVALGHILIKDFERAQLALRAFSVPVDYSNQIETIETDGDIRCAQLLWFLAEPTAHWRVKFARLRAFRGEKFSESELLQISEIELLDLIEKTKSELPKFEGSCSSFYYFKPIMEVIATR